MGAGYLTISETTNFFYNWNISSLSDGLHTIRIKGTDSAGNSSTANRTINIDNSVPVAELSNLPLKISDKTSIDITVGGYNIIAYKYNLNGAWSGEIDISDI